MSITKKLLKGKIYPDYSFSLGIASKNNKKAAEKKYDREYLSQEEPNYGLVADWLTGRNTVEGEFRSISEAPLLVRGSESSQKKRGVYGRHGITKFGRRFVKNACILLQRKYGRKRLGFATATLPSMDRDTCSRINGRISDITRRFYQKIKRKYQKRGSKFIYVGCIEVQEKRFGDTGIPALHLHFVFVAKDSLYSGYTLNTKDFYTAWNESVNQVLINSGGTPIMGYGGHKGSVKLEPIRSSAAAYLGKYLSKGCEVVKDMQERGFEEFPKQWWTACMQTKKMYKESIICMDANFASALFYHLEYFLEENQVTWAQFVDVEIAGEYRTMGLVGTFSKEAYWKIAAA